MSKDANPSFADVLKDVNKQYGLSIGCMSEVAEPVLGLTTGNLAIDYITGVGGLPVGRITELYGQPSSGKTTTALQTAAALQRKILYEGSDECIFYCDFEQAIDGDYAAALGLDVDHPSFVLVQPHWLEDGADISERVIKTGKVRLAIWDSVAEMTPKDLEFGVRTNAMERARLMNSLLQRLNSLLAQHKCAGVFLNHMTEAIQMGGRPGMPPQETSPGGKSLKFYASLRLAFKQIRHVKGKAADSLTGQVIDQVIATHVKVRATKNKIGIAQREAEVRVRLGQGFDNLWSALQVLVSHGEIKTSGAWHYFDRGAPAHPDMQSTGTGRPALHGEPAVLAFGDAHPDWRDETIAHAMEVIDKFGIDETTTAPDGDALLDALSADIKS